MALREVEKDLEKMALGRNLKEWFKVIQVKGMGQLCWYVEGFRLHRSRALENLVQLENFRKFCVTRSEH